MLPEEPASEPQVLLASLVPLLKDAGLAGCGLLLQCLPAQAAIVMMAAAEAVGVAYCSTRRELWQARWPAEPAGGSGR